MTARRADSLWGGGGADTYIFDPGNNRLVGGKKVIMTFDDDRDVFLGMERLEFADIADERQGGEQVEIA